MTSMDENIDFGGLLKELQNYRNQVSLLQREHEEYWRSTERRLRQLEEDRIKDEHRYASLKTHQLTLETHNANLSHEVLLLKRSFQVIAGFQPRTSQLVPKACLWSDENTICNISGIYSCIGWHEQRPVYMNTEKRFFFTLRQKYLESGRCGFYIAVGQGYWILHVYK